MEAPPFPGFVPTLPILIHLSIQTTAGFRDGLSNLMDFTTTATTKIKVCTPVCLSLMGQAGVDRGDGCTEFKWPRIPQTESHQQHHRIRVLRHMVVVGVATYLDQMEERGRYDTNTTLAELIGEPPPLSPHLVAGPVFHGRCAGEDCAVRRPRHPREEEEEKEVRVHPCLPLEASGGECAAGYLVPSQSG